MIQLLSQRAKTITSDNLSEPVILCAADDNYVRSLAVTLHSAAEHLKPGNEIQAIILDGGISESNWMMLKESLANLPIEISTVRPDPKIVNDLMTSHHITHTAYFRLLAGILLPESIDRVIYLDSDLLVRDDISELWLAEIGNDYCLAVPDIACPYVDARTADFNYKKSSPYLAGLSPIANWRQLGLNGGASYFNSGVMVLNIRRWREERIELKLLECLRNNPNYIWCWDQYALNVVFAGEWSELPTRWNQGAHVFEFPDETYSPIEQQLFLNVRDNPAIIHFTTEWKPWHYHNDHPLRELFFEQLDKTTWAGWRPEKPRFSIRKTWERFAVGVVKQSYISFRKLAAVFT